MQNLRAEPAAQVALLARAVHVDDHSDVAVILRGELHQLVDDADGGLRVVDAGQQVAHVVDNHQVGLVGLDACHQVVHALLVTAGTDVEDEEVLVGVRRCQFEDTFGEDALG